MNEKKPKNKNRLIIFFGIILIVLIVIVYFVAGNSKDGQSDINEPIKIEGELKKDTVGADSISMPHLPPKKENKRVLIDILDPLEPSDPSDPLGPPPPDSTLNNENEVDETINADITTNTTVYEIVEVMPEYIGGQKALYDFIAENLVYPPKDLENNIEGSVIMGFIVEPNGSASDIKVLKTYSQDAANEAIRVTKLMKWKAGKQNGKPVRVKMRIPIRFKLNK